MTEEEWLAAVSPHSLLEFLEDRRVKRRLRLWLCECHRTIQDRIDPLVWRIVETAEAYIVECVIERSNALHEPCDLAAVGPMCDFVPGSGRPRPIGVAERLAWVVVDCGVTDTLPCNLLRDIFGNPFRPVKLALACRTPAVLALARAAYDERTLPSGELDADRPGVLADAGATGDILAHLRGTGPHVRGCRVPDLAPGKE